MENKYEFSYKLEPHMVFLCGFRKERSQTIILCTTATQSRRSVKELYQGFGYVCTLKKGKSIKKETLRCRCILGSLLLWICLVQENTVFHYGGSYFVF